MLSIPLAPDFFAGNTLTVARNLLGCLLVYQDCSGIIVETEAYRDDPASHAITRPKHGRMLYDTYGRIYIYFIYGMYHCLNFTTESQGVGAVLIRAVEPVDGIEAMQVRRKTGKRYNLTNGPGKLFQAFGIDAAHHGEEVGETIRVARSLSRHNVVVGQSARIGISKATDLPWRFFIKDNPYLSRPRF